MAAVPGSVQARLGVRQPCQAPCAQPDPLREEPFELDEAQLRAGLWVPVPRRPPLVEVVRAEKPEHAPLDGVEALDAALAGELLGRLVAPVVRVPEEPLRVEIDVATGDRAQLAGADRLGHKPEPV